MLSNTEIAATFPCHIWHLSTTVTCNLINKVVIHYMHNVSQSTYRRHQDEAEKWKRIKMDDSSDEACLGYSLATDTHWLCLLQPVLWKPSMTLQYWARNQNPAPGQNFKLLMDGAVTWQACVSDVNGYCHMKWRLTLVWVPSPLWHF